MPLANPHLEIEKNDELDPRENTALDEHNELHALLYTTAAGAVVATLLLVSAMLLLRWRPRDWQVDVVIVLFLLVLAAPLLNLAFLNGRRMYWHDHHRRRVLEWTEAKMQRDIDGDGHIGVVLHDNTWFVKAVRFWFDGGSTTFEESQRQLGLTLAQWRAARTAVIGSGIGIAVGRQGGGKGFRIIRTAWNDVLTRMPQTPQVYEESGAQPSLTFARDGDGPVSSLSR